MFLTNWLRALRQMFRRSQTPLRKRRNPIHTRGDTLEDRALLAVRVWNGASPADANWATAANWVGGVAPLPNDELVFQGNVRQVNNNNLTVPINSITINGSNWTMTGNPLVIGGANAAINHNATTTTFSIPTVIAGGTTINVSSGRIIFLAAINAANTSDLNVNFTSPDTTVEFRSTVGVTVPGGPAIQQPPQAFSSNFQTNSEIIFGGATFTTVQAITVDSNVELAANVVVGNTGVHGVQFLRAVDNVVGVPTLFTLTVNSGGDTIFGNGTGTTIGATRPIGGIITDDNALTGDRVVFDLGATGFIETEGPTGQTYGEEVLLKSDTELRSDVVGGVAGPIRFLGSIDAHQDAVAPPNLLVRSQGTTTFGDGITTQTVRDNIGRTRALQSLVTQGFNSPDLGSTVFNVIALNANDTTPTVTTFGAQNYQDGVGLTQNGIFTSTAGGDISFGGSIVSTSAVAANLRSLTVNTSGATRFGDGGLAVYGGNEDLDLDGSVDPNEDANGDGALSASLFLSAITTDAPGIVVFNALIGETNVAGPQTYNDSMFLSQSMEFAATAGGDINFNSTVNATQLLVDNFPTLTANSSGTTSFGNGGADFVGNLNNASRGIANVLTNGPGRTHINITGASDATPSIRTTRHQIYNDGVALVADTVLASTQAGDILFLEPLFSRDAGNPASLRVLTSGATLFGDGGLDVVGGSEDRDNDGVLDVDEDVNGGGALTPALPLRSIFTDAGGATIFALGTGSQVSVTTTLDQTYSDTVFLSNNTVLRSNNAGTISLLEDINGSDPNFPRMLRVETSGVTNLGDAFGADQIGNVNPLLALSIGAPTGAATQGTTNMFNTTINTFLGQKYSDVIRLFNDAILTNTGVDPSVNQRGFSDVVFDDTVDSGVNAVPRGLMVNAPGNTDFSNLVGSVNPLAFINTDQAGNVRLSGGAQTTGPQAFNDNAIIRAAMTVSRSLNNGSIHFGGTIDSDNLTAKSLFVFTGGLTRFGDASGVDNIGKAFPLATLFTDAPGSTLFVVNNASVSSPTVRTSFGQAFNDNVTLGLNSVFSSVQGGTIAFGGAVNGTGLGGTSLMVNTAGNEQFGDGIGADNLGVTNILSSLIIDGDGSLGSSGETIFDIVPSNNPTVRTLQGQTYNAGVRVFNNSVFTSTNVGNIAFSNSLDSAGGVLADVKVHTAGNTDFGNGLINDFVGAKNPLLSLSTDQPGFTRFFVQGSSVISPSVITFGAQQYNDGIILLANTVLKSLTNAAVTTTPFVRGNFFFVINPDPNASFALSGFYQAGAAITEIFQLGTTLNYRDENGAPSTGFLFNPTRVSRGALTGTINGSSINWSDGTVWNKIGINGQLVVPPTAGFTTVTQNGTNVTYVDAFNNITNGSQVTPRRFTRSDLFFTLTSANQLISPGGGTGGAVPPPPSDSAFQASSFWPFP